MVEIGYNTGVNHIKSSGALERTRYPFSTCVRGTDTMSDHTRAHSFPANSHSPLPLEDANALSARSENGTGTKRCSICKTYKAWADFGPDKRSSDGLRCNCRQCRRDVHRLKADEINRKRRAAYQQNPEPIKAQVRAYRQRNPEKVKESQRRYVSKVADKRKAYAKEWHQRNLERMRSWNRNYRNANADRIRQRERNYYAQNPHKERQKKHARRARVRVASGQFTAEQWANLKKRFAYTCLCCGMQEPDIQLTPDHVIPLVNGGANDIANVQPLCGLCNSRKGIKETDYRPQDWRVDAIEDGANATAFPV